MAKGLFTKIKNKFSKKTDPDVLTINDEESISGDTMENSSDDNLTDTSEEYSEVNFTMTDTQASETDDDISEFSSDNYDDILSNSSEKYDEDISEFTSEEYDEDNEEITSEEYDEDISEFTSEEYEEDISEFTSEEYSEDINNEDVSESSEDIALAAQSDETKPVKAKKRIRLKSLFKLRPGFFSIRNKIFVCFLVPVLFMILVGTLAYQRAVKGMSDKFRDTTQQTLKMASEYVDMISLQIETEASSYANDDSLNKYFLGLISDNFEKADITKKTRTNINTSQMLNPYINNIHIITSSDLDMFTTKKLDNTQSTPKGILEEYKEDVGLTGKLVKVWGDSHQKLDEYISLNPSEYIMCLQVISKKKTACIVIDLKKSEIQTFLQGFDLGKGTIIGFVTPNGKEVIYENTGDDSTGNISEDEVVFADKEFYQEALAKITPEETEDKNAKSDEELPVFGSSEVKFNGSKYLFIYSKCSSNNATLCALVPMKVVTGQAESIKKLTIGLVILATIIASIIGVLIAAGIQKNMFKITKGFGEVANGDLTVEIRSTGKDEFNGLANSATYMIRNNKKLVSKVNKATLQLENSANEVKNVSEIISDYSTDISKAIGEINQGMSRQSSHAQVCVDHTNVLSNEIKEVGRVVSKVEDLVSETEAMIEEGMSMVQLLGERAAETTEITATVEHNIEALQAESTSINKFVAIITEISDQTNLLSINASIEAARAGEARHGFAVVADEIRKLADDSAKAAGEISVNVRNISTQTQDSVNSARQAEEMVALQAQIVNDVIEVFQEMSARMTGLVSGLKDIVTSMEKADGIRHETIHSVRNISNIIDETATNATMVNGVIERLMSSVNKLNKVSDVLDENMEELKSEISVFKTE